MVKWGSEKKKKSIFFLIKYRYTFSPSVEVQIYSKMLSCVYQSCWRPSDWAIAFFIVNFQVKIHEPDAEADS